ncbi:MAG: FecR domain-containing protein, partial [Pseudomonadota bacterium]
LAGAYLASPVGLLADHRTGAGERLSVTLEDGSILELNTATAVSTDYSRRQRRIELHTGEVFLQVHENADRPFVVDAGAARVEVLGTAFAVRRSADGVDVIVTESKVSVTAPDREAAIVTAGQSVKVTDTGLSPVADANEQTALAWRRGRLVFESRPLSEVLSELDRYRPGRILIVDGALQHIPVTGSFANDRSDAALDTIERTLPVRLVRLSDFLVLVFADDES